MMVPKMDTFPLRFLAEPPPIPTHTHRNTVPCFVVEGGVLLLQNTAASAREVMNLRYKFQRMVRQTLFLSSLKKLSQTMIKT